MGFVKDAARIGTFGLSSLVLGKKKAKPTPPSMLTQYGSGTAVRTPVPPSGSLY